VNKIGSVEGRHILFLQGPMGNFFKKMDSAFRKRGAITYKIGLNMGDWFFSCRDNYTSFRDKPEAWASFIESFLKNNKIDKMFLFGDCRFYQSIALNIAYAKGVEVFVFEEGYVRPHYITMEKFGVNDYSRISRDPVFYEQIESKRLIPPSHAQASKINMILSASFYYFISNLFYLRYSSYKHHRDFSAIKELFDGIRGGIRKVIYPFFEKKYHIEIQTRLSKNYFFVPLQTYNDFQILQHSKYGSIEKFIIEVLESFAKYADNKLYLVFKHHPVDRGRKNYKSFITNQARVLGISQRVLVFYDVHLPLCLRHAKGTVTINSTVGLTSIDYGIPTITLGRANYDIEGLTNQCPLALFWSNPTKPNKKLFRKFKYYLITTTQLNGSFYGKFPDEFIPNSQEEAFSS